MAELLKMLKADSRFGSPEENGGTEILFEFEEENYAIVIEQL